MGSNFRVLSFTMALFALASCSHRQDVSLTVIDPGHFHATLLQKHNMEGVSKTVNVYAPAGEELDQYLQAIRGYNSRAVDPTSWTENIYKGADYLEKLPKAGNLEAVMLSGNNRKKTSYIACAVDKGYNVLSDKPMAINKSQWRLLRDVYGQAQDKDLVIMDLMTERYDTLNILVRKLLSDKDLFGELDCSDAPAVKMTSVHHFYKEVSGSALHRPAWYYDVTQQGEGIADVTTHLIDLVFWQCFPEQTIGLGDVKVNGARHSATQISAQQFKCSTGESAFPSYLDGVREGDYIDVYSNGSIDFTVKGVPVQMNVTWNWMPQEGSSDTFEAVYKGTKATIIVRQDLSTGFVKQVFVKPSGGREIMMSVPAECRIGHEDHFNLVAGQFLQYVRGTQKVPEWETQNTVTKYYITTTAVEMASK